MSVLINGLEIPEKDHVRVLVLRDDGRCIDEFGNVFSVTVVLPHGDLIDRDELARQLGITDMECGKTEAETPHGRLIDADALLQRAIPHGWSTPKWVSDIVIDDAPTIIDAEEGEA